MMSANSIVGKESPRPRSPATFLPATPLHPGFHGLEQLDTPRSDFWIRIRNAALQYIGVGWFLAQVFAVAAREFGWPAELGNWVILALGAGFVIAMLGETLRALRHRMSRVPTHRRGLLIAAIAALAALGIWLTQANRMDRIAGPAGLVSEDVGLFTATTSVDGLFVVHPQAPMIPTRVSVTRGQSLRMWGEGSVNVGLASLVEAARAGDELAYDWVGPAGEVDARGVAIIRRDRGKPGRELCLLSRDAPYGALLAMIVPSERIAPGTARSLTPDRDIFVVGDHLEITAQVSGFLVLGVNDVYLDREECDPEAFAAGREPGVFYRDNIGFFTARISVD